MDVAVRVLDAPGARIEEFLRARLAEFNFPYAGDDHHRLLTVLALRGEQIQTGAVDLSVPQTDAIAGGLLGGTYWGWLVIDILWVREDARGQGLGECLLAAAEAEALRRGCRAAHVDTMDFQAPGFYQKHGYTVWGVLDDLPEGHQRIFLKKKLG